MKIFYRVLAVHPDEMSITVRYWTDKMSENDLRTDPADKADPPARCRTDFNLNVWEPASTDDEIRAYILKYAPVSWFKLREAAKLPESKKALERLNSWVGKVSDGDPVTLTATGEQDITHLLGE